MSKVKYKNVEDFPKKITIAVSQEDIDSGKALSFTRCPVARAIRRAGFIKPSVGLGAAYNVPAIAEVRYGDGYYWWYALSRAARRAIIKFDKTGEMKPFRFVMKTGW